MKDKARDPVCGNEVIPKKTNWKYKFGKQTYYFCTLNCLVIFDEEKHELMNRLIENKRNKTTIPFQESFKDDDRIER